ncbi:MAG: hypothetical protein VYA76_03055, partial [Candidatus Neomarinimicrobiota bacterium]|nr:hypothetical protein [Candidatus Neomarinimicrobiota bacterium]
HQFLAQMPQILKQLLKETKIAVSILYGWYPFYLINVHGDMNQLFQESFVFALDISSISKVESMENKCIVYMET